MLLLHLSVINATADFYFLVYSYVFVYKPLQHCSHHSPEAYFSPLNALKPFGSWALCSPRFPSWLQGVMPWERREAKEGREGDRHPQFLSRGCAPDQSQSCKTKEHGLLCPFTFQPSLVPDQTACDRQRDVRSWQRSLRIIIPAQRC